MTKYLFLSIIIIISFLPVKAQTNSRHDKLKDSIIARFGAQPGEFAIAFKDLQSGETVFINEHTLFHAASTMKTPVMIEVFSQASAGKFSLSDSIIVKNEFRSIADSSMYSLHTEDDSETELYKHIGEKMLLSSLVYQMIINSSNLATNIVIEKVAAKNVMATMKALGANDIRILRGVEDNKAYEKGMNNIVTAFDLMLLFEKLALGKIVNATASESMIKILLDQHFNDIIPAKLPADIKVAHKTGWLAGVHHDSGIVYLPGGKKYVLVLLSKNLSNEKQAVESMATVSRFIYDYINSK